MIISDLRELMMDLELAWSSCQYLDSHGLPFGTHTHIKGTVEQDQQLGFSVRKFCTAVTQKISSKENMWFLIFSDLLSTRSKDLKQQHFWSYKGQLLRDTFPLNCTNLMFLLVMCVRKCFCYFSVAANFNDLLFPFARVQCTLYSMSKLQ